MPWPKLALSLAALLAAPVLTFAAENRCFDGLPKQGPYNVFRSYTYTDIQWQVDEFVSDKNWHTHSEAIAAGLSVGTIVYGVPLKIGGTFDQSKVAEWKSEYQKRTKIDYVYRNRTAFESITADKELSKIWLAALECVVRTTPVFGLQAHTNATDDCKFTFVASFISGTTSHGTPPPQPTVESAGQPIVQNGECTPWPAGQFVPPNGYALSCRRFGRSAASVTLNTSDAGAVTAMFPALPDLGVRPKEPKLITEFTKPRSRAIGLTYNDFRGDGNRPDGRTFMSYDFDVKPNVLGNIDSIVCAGCGAHSWQCESSCAPYHQLVERVGPNLSRIWFYTDSSLPPITVTISYVEYEPEAKWDSDPAPVAAWDAEASRTCPMPPANFMSQM